MTRIVRSLTTVFSVAFVAGVVVPHASAGCGDLSELQAPFKIVQSNPNLPARPAQAEVDPMSRGGASGPSIGGMWNFQFISLGNTGHSPSIPDGALLDYGYQVWHSDGTEFTNSAEHNPRTQNYCIGVWGQTGFNAYELNHFALQYDSTAGTVNGVANIREQITLSPSGDSLSGTFTIDVYDLNADHLDHVAGTLTATRVTVDTVVTPAP